MGASVSRTTAVTVFAILVLGSIALAFSEDGRLRTATSFGTISGGHRALFDVLTGLGVPVARSYEPHGAGPTDRPLWFIEPWYLCRTGDPEAEPAYAAALEGFLRRGGSAVVFLAAQWRLSAPEPDACDSLAGTPVPGRLFPMEVSGSDPGDHERDVRDEEGRGFFPGEAISQTIDTLLADASRTLEVPELATFVETLGWTPRAHLDGEPFLLERAVHGGRLFVVADGSFLQNRWLDGGEGVLFAVDLVRALGAPRIDEAAHGMRLAESGVRVLARAGTVPVFVGLVVLGGLWAWRHAAVPQALPDEDPSVAPALETFVAGLTTLYGRSRDWSQLAERYRKLSLDRIRAHFGLAPEVPSERLLDQLRAEQRAAPAELDRLSGREMALSRDDWLQNARELDRIVKEICR